MVSVVSGSIVSSGKSSIGSASSVLDKVGSLFSSFSPPKPTIAPAARVSAYIIKYSQGKCIIIIIEKASSIPWKIISRTSIIPNTTIQPRPKPCYTSYQWWIKIHLHSIQKITCNNLKTKEFMLMCANYCSDELSPVWFFFSTVPCKPVYNHHRFVSIWEL